MAVGRNGSYPSTVAVDLSTQADFLTDRGAYPVANLDTLIPALRKIVAWAKWRCVPVVSSLNSHRPCELDRIERIARRRIEERVDVDASGA